MRGCCIVVLAALCAACGVTAPARVDLAALVKRLGPVEARHELELRIVKDAKDVPARLALARLCDEQGRPSQALEALEGVLRLGGPLGTRWHADDRARYARLLAARGRARTARGAPTGLADLERARSFGARVTAAELAQAKLARAIVELRHVDAKVRAAGSARLREVADAGHAGALALPLAEAVIPARRGELGAWLWSVGAKRAAWEALAAWHDATTPPRSERIQRAYLAAYAWWTPLDGAPPPAGERIAPEGCRWGGCDVRTLVEDGVSSEAIAELALAPPRRTADPDEAYAWLAITLAQALRGEGGWGALFASRVDIAALPLDRFPAAGRAALAILTGREPPRDDAAGQTTGSVPARYLTAAARALRGAGPGEVRALLGPLADTPDGSALLATVAPGGTATPDLAGPSASTPTATAPRTAGPSTTTPAASPPTATAPRTAGPSTTTPAAPAPRTAGPSTTPAAPAPRTAGPSTTTPAAVPAGAGPAAAPPAAAPPAGAAPSDAARPTATPSARAPRTAAPAAGAPAGAKPRTAAPAAGAEPRAAAPAAGAPAGATPRTAAPAAGAPAGVAPRAVASATTTPAAPGTAAPGAATPYAAAVARSIAARHGRDADPADDRRAVAMLAAYARDPLASERVARDVIAEHADAAAGHAWAGAFYDALQDPARAREHWQAAADASPGEPALVAGLALALARANDPDAALVIATEAAAASGDPSRVWLAEAEALHGVGADVHALEAARAAIELATWETAAAAHEVAIAASDALGRTGQVVALRARRAQLAPSVAAAPPGDPTDPIAARGTTPDRMWQASRWNPRDVALRVALLDAALDPARRAAVIAELIALAGDPDPERGRAAIRALRGRGRHAP